MRPPTVPSKGPHRLRTVFSSGECPGQVLLARGQGIRVFRRPGPVVRQQDHTAAFRRFEVSMDAHRSASRPEVAHAGPAPASREPNAIVAGYLVLAARMRGAGLLRR